VWLGQNLRVQFREIAFTHSGLVNVSEAPVTCIKHGTPQNELKGKLSKPEGGGAAAFTPAVSAPTGSSPVRTPTRRMRFTKHEHSWRNDERTNRRNRKALRKLKPGQVGLRDEACPKAAKTPRENVILCP